MPVQSVTPILNVSSISQSLDWFEKLGWKRGFRWNGNGMIGEGSASTVVATFASVQSGDACLFLCCGAQGSRGTVMPKFPGDDNTDGVWMTWWMESQEDLDELYAVAVNNHLIVTYPPTNEPWGVREFHLRHPDGHMFRISSGSGEVN